MKKKISYSIIQGKIYPIIASFCFLCLIQNSSFAQTCIQVLDNPIALDGIVDFLNESWAEVYSQSFTALYTPFGNPNIPSNAYAFIAAKKSNQGLSDPDLLYIGIHVENDPELNNEDRLILFFDADGNNNWNPPDFAIKCEIGSDTPPSTEESNKNLYSVYYYKRETNAWGQQSPIPGPNSVIAKLSYDYEESYSGSGDPESEIWQVEIMLDAKTLGINLTQNGLGFKIGGLLYIYRLIGEDPKYEILGFPGSMPNTEDGLLYEPNEVNPDINDLFKINIGNCYDIRFAQNNISGVNAEDANGNSNSFTRNPHFEDNDNVILKKNHYSAEVVSINPSKENDQSPYPSGGTNLGKVKFTIMPWNAGAKDYITMAEKQISFSGNGQTQRVEIDWPQTKEEWNAVEKLFNKDSDHCCLDVTLEGFDPNVPGPEDRVWKNLAYVSSSKVKDVIEISLVGDGNLPDAKNKEFIVRFSTHNIPVNLFSSRLRNRTEEGEKAKSNQVNRPHGLMSGEFNFADILKPTFETEKWDFGFPNKCCLGLRYMGNGYFSMPYKPDIIKKMKVKIGGGLFPVNPHDTCTISPKAGGTLMNSGVQPPKEIPVIPGKVYTIIAFGTIDLDINNATNKENGAMGYIDQNLAGSAFLLNKFAYKPYEYIGALIGSFDSNFEKSFVIGDEITFYVPQGKTRLYLAINDIKNGYGNNGGDGFEVHYFESNQPSLPTHMPTSGNVALGIPARLRGGCTLPEFQIETFLADKHQNDTKGSLLQPLGYAIYGVYDTHPLNYIIFEPMIYGSYFIFDKKLNLDNGYTAGLRLAYRLNGYLRLEYERGWIFTENSGTNDKGRLDHQLFNIKFSPFYYDAFIPYITGGYGNVSAKYFNTNDKSNLYQVGLGFNLKLFSNFFLIAEGRYINIKNLWNQANSTNYQLSLGLIYQLKIPIKKNQ